MIIRNMLRRESYSATEVIATVTVLTIIVISSYTGLTQSRNGFIDNAGLYYPVFTESVGLGMLAFGFAHSIYEKSNGHRVAAVAKITMLIIVWLGLCALIAIYARQDIISLYKRLIIVSGIPLGIVLFLSLLNYVRKRMG